MHASFLSMDEFFSASSSAFAVFVCHDGDLQVIKCCVMVGNYWLVMLVGGTFGKNTAQGNKRMLHILPSIHILLSVLAIAIVE